MGSSRGAGARLLGFLADAQTRGVTEALRSLNLEGLAGRTIDEIFIGLVDYICPDGGTVDEGIAREAFIETIVELTVLGVNDLDGLTPDQMQTVFELYATHAIEARLCNDIGTKLITAPTDAQTALLAQEQLHDFIRNGVSDALTQARTETPILTQDRVRAFVDSVYERAFGILKALGDAEADQ
jgi:Glu-tRNA(Gln) amidotransferase subunit E-like FAD-binding protein